METKTCLGCHETKPTSEFHKGSNGALYAPRCKPCRSKIAAKHYRKDWFNSYVKLKRSFCKTNKLPFDLTEEYLKSIWTGFCPISGEKLVMYDKRQANSPALDRLVPALGYTKGNVNWMSARYNRIKYDATLEELKKLVEWYEGATTIPQGSTLK